MLNNVIHMCENIRTSHLKIDDTFLWESPAKYCLCTMLRLKSYVHQMTSQRFPVVLGYKILCLQEELNTVIIICDFIIFLSIYLINYILEKMFLATFW